MVETLRRETNTKATAYLVTALRQSGYVGKFAAKANVLVFIRGISWEKSSQRNWILFIISNAKARLVGLLCLIDCTKRIFRNKDTFEQED